MKFIHHLTLVVIFAATTCGNVQANSAAPASAVGRYPWDNRPNKCLASTDLSAACKEDNWPNLPDSVRRFQTLLTDPDHDAALLVRASNELGASTQRYPTGEYHFEALYLAIESQFYGADDQDAEAIGRWKKASVKPGFEIFGEAMYEWRKAWAARGKGYAASISPEAWKIYYDKLNRSLSILKTAPADVQKSGPYHILTLELTYSIPELKAQRLNALDAATTAWPFSATLYGVATRFAQPRWGGSFLEMDGIAQLAAKRTSQHIGDSMYAIVYERAFRRGSNYSLRESRVNWPRLKLAFRDVEKHSLGAEWLSRNFAELACQMRDRDEAVRLFRASDIKVPRSAASETDPCRAFAEQK